MNLSPSFIGRTQELARIEERWRSSQPEFLVLLGRRRVGKSELLRQFCQGKSTLFFVGTRSESRSQIHHFMEELGRVAGEPDWATLPIHTWEDALPRLTQYLRKKPGRTLVVFDEFPWAAQASPELPSLLQREWDTHWSRQPGIFLALCGSLLGFMEREVLGHKSPLFGRRTAVIHLQPLPFNENRRFHPTLPLLEQARRHLLCGGIPSYHKVFSSGASLAEELLSAFFSADAPLAREADYLLLEELKEPKFYFSLLEVLGPRRMRLTDLASQAGVERTRIPYYTKTLTELGYIEKISPVITYRTPSPRASFYRIADPLLRFWFTFVYPHMQTIQRMDPRVFFTTIVAPRLEVYWGHEFESLAMELFLEKKLTKTVEPFQVGSYWDKTRQIDFTVALASGTCYAGEVKWGPLGMEEARGFLKKLATFPVETGLKPVFISSRTIPQAVRQWPQVESYTLKELTDDTPGHSTR